ncbi:hypothetical protein MARINOS108_110021 [Marinoscillum sp. 108]|nr:hypothetical protein MARINOS108_110021 [Marinoscillum sp. 108]
MPTRVRLSCFIQVHMKSPLGKMIIQVPNNLLRLFAGLDVGNKDVYHMLPG